jgi:hypothetical protein
MVGGIFLIVIGIGLLFAQLSPDLSRYIVLVIGIGLLIVFALTRRYGALVAASIVTGVGVGIVLADMLSGDMAAAAVLLSIGGGFAFIWLVSYAMRMPDRHYWPLIPAAILGTIGGALAIGADPRQIETYWPAALIAIGAVLIVASLLRREGRAT